MMIKTRYISPAPFCTPQELIRSSYQHMKGVPDWWNTPSKQTICFHRARTCIAFSCKLLGMHSGDEVLIPSYNCGSEIDPLLFMGMKVIMYRVDHNGQVDLDDVERRITEKTRALYVTHYFGWPQDTIKLKQICTDRGLKLIEDCALALFSQSETSPMGRLCDASVYSLPKFLPVPDGGFLVLNLDVAPAKQLPGKPLLGEIIKSSLPFLKRWFLSGFGSISDTSYAKNKEIKSSEMNGVDRCPSIPESYYYDPLRYHRSMSKTTRGLLNLLNIEDIVNARKRNYTALLEAITHSTSIRPFFNDLPSGVCPIMLPLVVEDRHVLVSWLKSKGIPAIAWWSGYHRKLDWSEFSEARYLKDHIVCLPVHQNLNDDHLNHMIDCLLEWEAMIK